LSKRVIRFELSPEGIDKAIEEIERFKIDMLKAMAEVINALGLRAYGTATLTLESNAKVVSSELIDSLAMSDKATFDNRVFFVRTDCEYAVFVEYGTGIKGAEHPEASRVGWEKNQKGKGEAGWPFFSEAFGEWYTTHGQGATPFMYNAKMTVKNEAEKYVATIFGRL